FLPWDLYDGGACPVVGSQTNVRYVDVENGSDSNNGLTAGAPWLTLRDKTVADAIIYITGGTSPTPSPSNLHFMGTSSITNCTIRPIGETPARIVSEEDPVANTTRGCFYMRNNDGTYEDITFYK